MYSYFRCTNLVRVCVLLLSVLSMAGPARGGEYDETPRIRVDIKTTSAGQTWFWVNHDTLEFSLENAKDTDGNLTSGEYESCLLPDQTQWNVLGLSDNWPLSRTVGASTIWSPTEPTAQNHVFTAKLVGSPTAGAPEPERILRTDEDYPYPRQFKTFRVGVEYDWRFLNGSHDVSDYRILWCNGEADYANVAKNIQCNFDMDNAGPGWGNLKVDIQEKHHGSLGSNWFLRTDPEGASLTGRAIRAALSAGASGSFSGKVRDRDLWDGSTNLSVGFTPLAGHELSLDWGSDNSEACVGALFGLLKASGPWNPLNNKEFRLKSSTGGDLPPTWVQDEKNVTYSDSRNLIGGAGKHAGITFAFGGIIGLYDQRRIPLLVEAQLTSFIQVYTQVNRPELIDY